MTEAIEKLIEAVDLINRHIGLQRVGGLNAANEVGILLHEAKIALGIGETP